MVRVLYGGAGGGGHEGILIGDPSVSPATVNPQDHTNNWTANQWFWEFSQVTASATPVGQVWTASLPGDTWSYGADAELCFTGAAGSNPSFTLEPAFTPTDWDTILCQWQRIGVGAAPLAGQFLVMGWQIGWKPTGVCTPGAADYICFEKNPADNTLYASISDSAANSWQASTGITLAKGTSYKLAVRIDCTNSIAYFYVNDQMTNTQNATALAWWPSILASNPWEAQFYAGPDGFIKPILVKPPWIVMGKV